MAKQTAEVAREPLVRSSDETDLIYKERFESLLAATAAAPMPDLDTWLDAFGQALAEERDRERSERAADIAKLNDQIAALRECVDVLRGGVRAPILLLGGSKSAETKTTDTGVAADVVPIRPAG